MLANFKTLIGVVSVVVLLMWTAPSAADKLHPRWEEARNRFNALYDAAERNDPGAAELLESSLIKAIDDCKNEPACWNTSGQRQNTIQIYQINEQLDSATQVHVDAGVAFLLAGYRCRFPKYQCGSMTPAFFERSMNLGYPLGIVWHIEIRKPGFENLSLNHKILLGVASDLGSIRATNYLAKSYESNDKPIKAVELFEKILKLSPTKAERSAAEKNIARLSPLRNERLAAQNAKKSAEQAAEQRELQALLDSITDLSGYNSCPVRALYGLEQINGMGRNQLKEVNTTLESYRQSIICRQEQLEKVSASYDSAIAGKFALAVATSNQVKQFETIYKREIERLNSDVILYNKYVAAYNKRDASQSQQVVQTTTIKRQPKPSKQSDTSKADEFFRRQQIYDNCQDEGAGMWELRDRVEACLRRNGYYN
ncbi:MAG: hypothetical protein OQJ80_06705 [Kangiella sp.]|nr:hypothetical protein [Kangiella sp.]